MGFRRSSEDAKEKQQWKAFLRVHLATLCEVGVPEHVYREKSRFDHWLMHGHDPLDPSMFMVEDLDQEQRARLVELLRAYIEAGFKDPGISFITEEERRTILGTG